MQDGSTASWNDPAWDEQRAALMQDDAGKTHQHEPQDFKMSGEFPGYHTVCRYCGIGMMLEWDVTDHALKTALEMVKAYQQGREEKQAEVREVRQAITTATNNAYAAGQRDAIERMKATEIDDTIRLTLEVHVCGETEPHLGHIYWATNKAHYYCRGVSTNGVSQ